MFSKKMHRREFTLKLAKMCLTGEARSLPAEGHDRQVLLKSAALSLDPHRKLSVDEVDAALGLWLAMTSGRFKTDRTMLRRALLSEGYLDLTPFGSFYVPTEPRVSEVEFDRSVDGIDVYDVLLHGMADSEGARRCQFPAPGSEAGRKLAKARMVAVQLLQDQTTAYRATSDLSELYDADTPFLCELKVYCEHYWLCCTEELVAKQEAERFLASSDEWVESL
jgi:hypothetical protein